jgi:iron complex transport system substrate-binding protein
MPRPTPLLSAAIAAAALFLATACGSGGTETNVGSAGETTGPTTGAPQEAAFPVTIKHKYGETKLTEAPKRVMSVGLVEQDALLALGVVPVGTSEWFGEQPGAIFPWAKDDFDKLGGKLPTVLPQADGIQYEKIAALQPDLIIALYSDLTKKDYDTLTAIAPVVANPGEYPGYGIGWEELTLKVGQAVGKPAEAQKLIDDTRAKIAEVKTAHPEFAGKTGLMATPWQGMFVYGTSDPRSRLLTSLGFKLPPDLDKAIGDEFGANISKERMDLVDTDVLIMIIDKYAKDRAALNKDPLYADLAVVKEGRDLLIETGTPVGAATSFISVLSLPFLLDDIVPRISAAVDDNPATKVEPVKA